MTDQNIAEAADLLAGYIESEGLDVSVPDFARAIADRSDRTEDV